MFSGPLPATAAPGRRAGQKLVTRVTSECSDSGGPRRRESVALKATTTEAGGHRVDETTRFWSLAGQDESTRREESKALSGKDFSLDEVARHVGRAHNVNGP